MDARVAYLSKFLIAYMWRFGIENAFGDILKIRRPCACRIREVNAHLFRLFSGPLGFVNPFNGTIL
jgi:hypothetical protein